MTTPENQMSADEFHRQIRATVEMYLRPGFKSLPDVASHFPDIRTAVYSKVLMRTLPAGSG